MSKQSVRKNQSGAARVEGGNGARPAKSGGSAPVKGGARGAQGGAPVRQSASARAAAARPRPKSGFRLRPLDIALLVAGVALVGAIIWGALGTNNNNLPAASVPTDGSPPVQAAGNTVPIGQPVPPFTLPDTDNKNVSLSDYAGKVVVLEFMAPWCPHCQEDAPMLNEVAAKYTGKDVQFLGVSATPQGRDRSKPITMEDMVWFKNEFKVSFPMLFDKDVKAAAEYGVMYYPTIYVLDKAGNVSAIPTGAYTMKDGQPESIRTTAMTADELSAEIDKALAKEEFSLQFRLSTGVEIAI
ncbi:MAG TPA: TlpA disulfide reductase family protein [Chloroflexia bacterium]|nr:TlpA disulfide reductase family protein [Chloroflexia bacterium]